jgi:protein-tyrosine phosphatase
MTTASLPHISPHSSPLPSDPYSRRSLSHTSASPLAVSSTPRPAVSRHGIGVAAEPATHAASPNHFNLSIDGSKSCQSSAGGAHARTNWSPPSSRVRSTAAASPRIIPVDQNPEYAAFKRQSEIAGPNNLNFTLSHFGGTNDDGQVAHSQNTPFAAMGDALNGVVDEKPASPKRPLSSPSNSGRYVRMSPASFNQVEASNAPQGLQPISDEPMQISLPASAIGSPQSPPAPRAETLPAYFPKAGLSGIPFASPADVAAVIESENAGILMLDMRVSTLYARSRIQGALNLCIPTTLLKRPAYDTKRLAATFDSQENRRKFEDWPNYQYVIVYDGGSSPRKDASGCENMLKKFEKAGWSGTSYIIAGGFNEFSKQFPSLVQHDVASSGGMQSPSAIAPVIGGCPMPAAKTMPIPFFSNIRQNMDLMGGVGRISVKRPRSLSSSQMESIPKWLREASDEEVDGKLVSHKFLAIEQQEKKRMEDALSEQVIYAAQTDSAANCIRIAGMEKGAKNRYNNIWPYEHSRVKLGGELPNSCDYVNASFVKAAGTNKRYIATQCPLPATFTVSIVSPYSGANNMDRIFGTWSGSKTCASSSCSRPRRSPVS